MPNKRPPTRDQPMPPGRLKLGPRFEKQTQQPIETIRFRFRTRIISATVTTADSIHRNVCRLHIQPSTVQRLICLILGFFPSPVSRWFKSAFPEWSLAPEVILKKQKEGWDEEFNTEKATYAQLRPLQGVVVPKLIGELELGGNRALLLSDIGSADLASPEACLLKIDDFRRMLSQALTALAQFGISHGDEKLDNYHLVGDKIMVVDFELVNDRPLTEKQLERNIGFTVEFLAEHYQRRQHSLWKTGLIQIDSEETKL
ncbi:hypothetical protein B0T24DRAFT_529550 [Lasiosphaeria ovina]|uniref:Protein kinase domain-containing protein n=1 Tax=Lasiosphaeria ovina TaxID=92902 RepID=A0AAE0KCX6_9PEZI|nr:hypothetical protein B0T24DRAFT_529550 [Lasiosphaeria ovina]